MSMIGKPASRRRQTSWLLGAVALTALSAAVLPSLGAGHEATVVRAATESAAVTINHHAFAPAELTINAGTTVTWKNDDDTPHTVRERSQTFASGALDNGDSFSHTFATPGEYTYFCSLHPFMVGKVIVKPAGKSS